jgi:hypothetical protein
MESDYKEEILADLADKLKQFYEKCNFDNKEEIVNSDGFTEIQKQIQKHDISPGELVSYLSRKGIIKPHKGHEVKAFGSMLVYERKVERICSEEMTEFFRENYLDDEERINLLSEWAEDSLMNDMIDEHLKFSRSMERISDVCLFNLGRADSGVYISIVDCIFKGEDSREQFAKYAKELTSKSVVSLEMRNLKDVMNMLSVAVLIDGDVHKVSYFDFTDDWKVKKKPSFVFTDKESHDRWVSDQIDKLKKNKIQEMKEAIKNIFAGIDVEIREIDPKDLPDDIKKMVSKDMVSKEKKKPGGRFDFLSN